MKRNEALSLSIRCVILFSIFISRVFASSNSSSVIFNAPQCHIEESSALLQFQTTFSDTRVNNFLCDDHKDTALWNRNRDCCKWDGIRCDAVTGHVVELSLSCVTLQSAITSDSSLFQLTHLKKLILDSNDFRGSRILPEFGHFKNLTELSLLGSNFRGDVPLEIARLTKLVSFSLSSPNNGEQVTIGTSAFKGLAQNATKLRELFFLGVDMSTMSLASMANLSSSLTTLSLVSCALNGELLKTDFHFQNLRSLELQGNNLHGTFPWSSVNLESFSHLDLSHNNFTGQLPGVYSNFSRKVSTKYSLSHFLLRNNLFDGTIPSWIYEQPSLKFLDLGNNLFTGELNEFQTTSLVCLSVGGNKLHGQIPKSIFRNEKLELVDISSNNFTGNLEMNFSKLKELSHLSISPNNLSLIFDNSKNHTLENLVSLFASSCNIREFPNFLESSNGLLLLDLSYNQMQGSLPKWFEELGKDSLFYMNISHNFLTSNSIEPRYWTNLQFLDLSSNLLSGPLPIPSLSILNVILVSDNQFSGPIPTSICNLTSLSFLDLSNNNLSGNIPRCIGTFSEVLMVFDARNNNLGGIIPANFSRAHSLRSLNLNGNRLEGPLPRSLAYCKSLQVVDLGNNDLNDTFPNWLETLPELRVLVLRANKFHGHIGAPNISNPFPELRIIDLSNNGFNGSLPVKYLENFEAMTDEENVKMEYMGVDYYQDSIGVNIKGNSIELVKILTIFTTIDFSNNNFRGKIPKIIGKLKSLKNLNLSHNMIRGTIPSSLGNLSNLEGLDLSCNELVGKIPNQFLDINWLSFMNLSYNHLEGSIPRGKQFDTFNNNSYKGNLGLCGFPLSESCNIDKVQHDQGGDGIALEWKVVMIGYASGVVIGISIGYIVLFTRSFDRWSMKSLGRQSRQRSIHPSRGRRQRT